MTDVPPVSITMPSAVRETLVNGALALGWQQSLNHLAMLVEPEIKD